MVINCGILLQSSLPYPSSWKSLSTADMCLIFRWALFANCLRSKNVQPGLTIRYFWPVNRHSVTVHTMSVSTSRLKKRLRHLSKCYRRVLRHPVSNNFTYSSLVPRNGRYAQGVTALEWRPIETIQLSNRLLSVSAAVSCTNCLIVQRLSRSHNSKILSSILASNVFTHQLRTQPRIIRTFLTNHKPTVFHQLQKCFRYQQSTGVRTEYQLSGSVKLDLQVKAASQVFFGLYIFFVAELSIHALKRFSS